jgi:gamma-glutamyltranspeptidase/glutathione hydrolase
MNLFDFDMGLQEAGDAPRINHTGSADPTGKKAIRGGGRVHLEPGFSPETIHELEHRGHHLSKEPSEYGGYQAIWYDAQKDVYFGATESRKDGIALGY